MSQQQKDQKVKNRYSKSQQIQNTGAFNFNYQVQNPNDKAQENDRQYQYNQVTTQSEFMKTQEGIIDTEISQHALMLSPNAQVSLFKNNYYYPKTLSLKFLDENNDEDDVFEALYSNINKDQSKKDAINEENTKEQSEKQKKEKRELDISEFKKPSTKMSYEMQNLIRLEGGGTENPNAQIYKDLNEQTQQFRNTQSINTRIPLTEFLEQNTPLGNTSQQNNQDFSNTNRYRQGETFRNSRVQNDQLIQDKLRHIQNLKSKKNESVKSTLTGAQKGFGNDRNQNSDQNSESEKMQQDYLKNQRKTLRGASTKIFNENENKGEQNFENMMNIENDANRDDREIREHREKAQQNWKFVNHLNVMQRFKQKIFQMIQQRIENCSNFHHYMIGDCTDAPNIKGLAKQRKMNSLYYKIFLETYNSESFIVIYYKMFLTLVTLFNIIYLPLIFGFDLDLGGAFKSIHSTTIFIFLFEMYMRFRLTYYHMGEIVTDKMLISKKYLFNEFITDSISIVAMIIGYQYRPALLFILLRTLNISQYLWDIDNHYYLAEQYNAIWIMIKLFGFITILCHCFACVFHYTAYIQESTSDVTPTWTSANNLIGETWTLRYNYAIYFSFITCITIGYGDITPKNTSERNVVIVISLISTGCFSYSVNTMATIFQDYLNKQKKSKEMRYDAINYMRERNIHKNLQLRVLKYIEYIYQMEAKSPDKGLFAINQISSQLKAQLFQDYYGKIISQDKHFSLNYSQETIDKFSLKMKEKIYGPGEIIFEQGEQDTRIFFLMKGEIEFLFQNKGNKSSEQLAISQSNRNCFVGYKGFISGIPREMSCKSKNVTQVFYCDREDLVSVLKENPLEYEKFCMLRDEYLINQSSLGEPCFSCKEYGHTISTCYKIRFVKKREVLILKQTYTRDQITSFEAMKCKLKYVNILKFQKDKSFIPVTDEVIEKIIIEDSTSDKKFSMKYPFIQHSDNTEMYLCYASDQISECSDSSDSSLTSDLDSNDESNSSLTVQSQGEENLSQRALMRLKTQKKLSEKQSKSKLPPYPENGQFEEKVKRSFKKNDQENQIVINLLKGSNELENSSPNIMLRKNNSSNEKIQSNLLGQGSINNGNVYNQQQINELTGIQVINNPTQLNQNNLKLKESSNFQKGLLASAFIKINKTESAQKIQEIEIDKLSDSNRKVRKEMDDYQAVEDFTVSVNENVGKLNEPKVTLPKIKEIKDGNYSQDTLKVLHNIKGKLFSSPKSTPKHQHTSSGENKFANLAKQLQVSSHQKKQSKLDQGLLHQVLGQRHQNSPQNQFYQLTQQLANNSPMIPMMKTNEFKDQMMLHFLTGQLQLQQLVGQQMQMMQSLNPNKSQAYLTNSFVGGVDNINPQISMRLKSSIKEDNKLDSQTVVNQQKRAHTFDFNEYNRLKALQQTENRVMEEDLFIYDFDSLKEYSLYFPHNNYTTVCNNYKRIMRKQQQQQKKGSKQINVAPAVQNIVQKNYSKFKKYEQEALV